MSVFSSVVDSLAGLGHTAWDIFAQKKTWDREDSAIQRRVADLRAAGLSPTLAAGSAAQTSGPINVSALPSVTGLMESNADIARTKQQDKLLRMQTENTAAEATVKRFEANVAEKLSELQDANGNSGAALAAMSRLSNTLAGAQEAQARARELDSAAQLRATQAADARRNLDMAKREGVRTNLPGGNLGLGLGIQEYAPHFISSLLEQVRRATPSWSRRK